MEATIEHGVELLTPREASLRYGTPKNTILTRLKQKKFKGVTKKWDALLNRWIKAIPVTDENLPHLQPARSSLVMDALEIEPFLPKETEPEDVTNQMETFLDAVQLRVKLGMKEALQEIMEEHKLLEEPPKSKRTFLGIKLPI